MNFTRRLRFFGMGLLLGVFLSLILFGPEKFSCAGYLPEGRVLAELQTKKFENTLPIQQRLDSLGFAGDLLKEKLIRNSTINFSESQAQLKPCPEYSMYYPEDSAYLHYTVYKCDSTAFISSIRSIK